MKEHLKNNYLLNLIAFGKGEGGCTGVSLLKGKIFTGKVRLWNIILKNGVATAAEAGSNINFPFGGCFAVVVTQSIKLWIDIGLCTDGGRVAALLVYA